jgi:histidinol phosphatase-like PHP family hydrolase/predicted nuclease with RNAse H fold
LILTSSKSRNQVIPGSKDYFRLRDFEYAQPLYDLAFLLEVNALSKGSEIPKYRTFSLWRAGYSLDGYGTTIDQWLDGKIDNEGLDNVPSARIRQYLKDIRQTGTVSELSQFRGEEYERCLRLRSMRGLGASRIATSLLSDCSPEEWLHQSIKNVAVDPERLATLYYGGSFGPWQSAHVVPPLLRFLSRIEEFVPQIAGWQLKGITDSFLPVSGPVSVTANVDARTLKIGIDDALGEEKQFSFLCPSDSSSIRIRHQIGWSFTVQSDANISTLQSIQALAQSLDPFASSCPSDLLSDLHLHTAWSDGNASVNTMAMAVVARGLQYFAVTDHSRSSKLQGGLTPHLWLRQANALQLATPVCPVMHGIEVDILTDGTLDLPDSLLAATDLVVASVHSNWSEDAQTNTDRLLRAIESGFIDILAHPTSALLGTPGVPSYLRPPANVFWDDVFRKCSQWKVAVELNCFPSRLDLSLELLERAIDFGCAISIGSDAHSRSHLINLRFGDAALRRLRQCVVLNRFSYDELRTWIRQSRSERNQLPRNTPLLQAQLMFGDDEIAPRVIRAFVRPPSKIPSGSRVVGIDLTAGDKATGVATLSHLSVDTCSLFTDEEILRYVKDQKPRIVSIDSPLGLPGGGDTIDPKAGIMRVAEYDLASIGIPAYPSLIDSMERLTLRGIRLRQRIEQLPDAPQVLESYPGAAQDILCIPRKQKSLSLLREGLRRLGLEGSGLETQSHDEIDAITSAIVGRYFEAGLFEPMGIISESQLIVPKVGPLQFGPNPLVCLAGDSGSGKSVIARYLSVFYGFHWVRTPSLIADPLNNRVKGAYQDTLFQEMIGLDEPPSRDSRFSFTQTLGRLIGQLDGPIIVDSLYDMQDINSNIVGSRPVFTWFVECSDSAIRERISRTFKSGKRQETAAPPLQSNSTSLRRTADQVILNSGSLEDLRWQVDDILFAMVSIHPLAARAEVSLSSCV